MPHVEHGAETPNQQHKQQQIIEAAGELLASEGLAGCSVRAVADAGPLTKSAVHYYFRDVQEIVDRAMGAHLDGLAQTLRELADAEADPGVRLWRVIDAYLQTFADKPHAALLWFEYWIALSRRDATGPVREDLNKLRALFGDLLAAADHPAPDAAADTILSWLLGTVVQQSIAPEPAQVRRDNLERLLALTPRPHQ